MQRILGISKGHGSGRDGHGKGSKAVEQGARDAVPSQVSIQAMRSASVKSQAAVQIAAATEELLLGVDQVTRPWKT